MFCKSLYILFLSLLFSCSQFYPENKGSGINITQYDFKINYQTDQGHNKLNVKATILIQKDEGTENTNLLFNPDSKIISIKCKNGVEWIPIEYKFIDDNQIHLTLPSSLSSAKEINIQFDYNYPIEDSIKTICYLDRGYRWYPLIIDDIAQFEMTANIPNNFEMFSGGDLIKAGREKDYSTYKWKSKIPVFKIPFILIKEGMYDKISQRCADKEISFFFLGKDSISQKKIINEACNTFQFCDTLIGSYTNNQLTFIEMPDMPATIIGSGIIIVGSDIVQQFKQNFYNALHLAIAAQWFGSSVFGKFKDKGFWFFSVSLPHYLRLMYIEHSKGKDAFNNELYEPYKKYTGIAGSDKDFPVLSMDMIDTKGKGLVIYGKGPYILDVLRKQINKKRWITFLQELYKNYRGKILTYDEFKKQLPNLSKEEKLDLKFEKMMSKKGVINNE